MKRDWEAIRNILIAVEDMGPNQYLTLHDFVDSEEFPHAAIAYNAELLRSAGLVEGHNVSTLGPEQNDFSITSLTWEGHELFDAIRTDTIWNKTKESFVKAGASMTFELVKSVAIKAAQDLLT